MRLFVGGTEIPISYHNSFHFVQKSRLLNTMPQKYLTAFRQFDKDDSGSISIEELRIILEDDDEFSPEDVAQMLKDVDADKSGEITYEEFEKLVEKYLK